MSGRRPLPSALKRAAGNPGKRPLNENEPTPELEIPKCPSHLDKHARKEWRRISLELEALGLLTKMDRAALAGYCQAWGRWVDAEQNIRKYGAVIKTPTGFPIQNPYLAIANTAVDQMRKFLTEFGMTPSSRSRISVRPKKGKAANVFDELAGDSGQPAIH